MLTKLSVLGGAGAFLVVLSYIVIGSAAGVTGVMHQPDLQTCNNNVDAWVSLNSKTMAVEATHYYAVRYAKVRLACRDTIVREGVDFRASPAVAALASTDQVMQEAATLFAKER